MLELNQRNFAQMHSPEKMSDKRTTESHICVSVILIDRLAFYLQENKKNIYIYI